MPPSAVVEVCGLVILKPSYFGTGEQSSSFTTDKLFTPGQLLKVLMGVTILKFSFKSISIVPWSEGSLKSEMLSLMWISKYVNNTSV